MNNRNIAIGVGVVILLWWLSRKKKDTVDEMVESTEGGGGGGGGIGGGLLPSFPIPPIDIDVNTGSTTGGSTTTGSKTKTSDEKTDAQYDPTRDTKGKVGDDVVLEQTFTYVQGVALRPFRVKTSATASKTFNVGDKIDIAEQIRGSNTTHPRINPAQTLLLGTDVDFATPTVGGVKEGESADKALGKGTGGTISGGTFTPKDSVTVGGVKEGTSVDKLVGTQGTLSGGTGATTTSGSTIPRAGAIGSKSGGSTKAGGAPSGAL